MINLAVNFNDIYILSKKLYKSIGENNYEK